MSARQSHQLQQIAELEKSLLWRIDAAAEDLQRVECLDEEQRAEVHTILEAMKHESESHAALVRVLAGACEREAYSA